MKRTAIIIVFVSAIAGRAWGAPPGDLSAFAEKNGYSSADVAKLNSLVAAASSQGLAPGPLADKAREGIAKHVPPKQLLAALRKMADRMQSAQQALPASLRTSPVVQAADLALAAGYSPAGVRAVADAAGGKAEPYRVQAALYALGVLHDAGASEKGAVPFVAAQLHAGLTAVEIEDTTRAGARALRAGLINNEELGRTSPDDLKGANRAEWRNLMNGVQAVRPGGTPAQVRGVIERRDAESRDEKRIESRGDVAAPIVTPPGQPKNDDDDHDVEDDKPQSDDHLSSDRKR